jgi:hypothetical protein
MISLFYILYFIVMRRRSSSSRRTINVILRLRLFNMTYDFWRNDFCGVITLMPGFLLQTKHLIMHYCRDPDFPHSSGRH